MPKTSQNRATASSSRLRTLATKATPAKRVVEKRVLNQKGIRDSIAQSNASRRLYRASVVKSSSDILMMDLDEDSQKNNDFENGQPMELDDVLDGTSSFNLSHAGGEFEHIVADVLHEESIQRSKHKDHRMRRDRTQNQIDAFQMQMDGIVDAYMVWAEKMGDDAMEKRPEPRQTDHVTNAIKLHVMDAFKSYTFSISFIDSDTNVPAALLSHGLLPTAPLRPSFAFSIRVVELYRITHLRSPHLTIEPFVKSLCDLHRTPFRRYLAQQFSVAFDLYLAIRASVSARVDAALSRNVPK
ncbi:hypothetical protein C0992_013013 [Termitomyces sp. T32_za158]|nr:hypothetical protein C0992_013013 [Termitomyces sp. T32_za158]